MEKDTEQTECGVSATTGAFKTSVTLGDSVCNGCTAVQYDTGMNYARTRTAWCCQVPVQW